MAGSEMLQLGDYVFSASTAAYQSIQRHCSWRWEKLNRVNRPPAHQFTGMDEDAVTLDGVMFTAFAPDGDTPVGEYEMEKLRADADRGEPLMLVDGRGNVFGMYIITTIKETGKNFLRDGTPRKLDFTIDLERYGEDSTDEPKRFGQAALRAGKGFKYSSTPGDPVGSTQAAKQAKDQADLLDDIQDIVGDLSRVTTDPVGVLAGQPGVVGDLAKTVQRLSRLSDTVSGSIRGLPSINLFDNLYSLRQRVSDLRNDVVSPVQDAVRVGRTLEVLQKDIADIEDDLSGLSTDSAST